MGTFGISSLFTARVSCVVWSFRAPLFRVSSATRSRHQTLFSRTHAVVVPALYSSHIFQQNHALFCRRPAYNLLTVHRTVSHTDLTMLFAHHLSPITSLSVTTSVFTRQLRPGLVSQRPVLMRVLCPWFPMYARSRKIPSMTKKKTGGRRGLRGRRRRGRGG